MQVYFNSVLIFFSIIVISVDTCCFVLPICISCVPSEAYWFIVHRTFKKYLLLQSTIINNFF